MAKPLMAKNLSDTQLQALGLPSAAMLLQRADGAVQKANIAKNKGLVVVITTASIADREETVQQSNKGVGCGTKLSAAARAHYMKH